MPTVTKTVLQDWLFLGDAPCVIENQSTTPVRVYIGTDAPTDKDNYSILRSDDMDGMPVRGAGVKAWAYVPSDKARVVVSPSAETAGGSSGGGDASAANQAQQIALDRPVQGVIDMPTAGTAYAAGRAVEIECTTTGEVTLTYVDGSTRTRKYVADDTPYRLPDAVTKWEKPSGSAFVGRLCNLK